MYMHAYERERERGEREERERERKMERYAHSILLDASSTIIIASTTAFSH